MDMGADNLQTLQRGLRDLVALTTLPAIWVGSQPHQIAESLAEVMLTTLRLDLVYIALREASERLPLELVLTNQRFIKDEAAQAIGKILSPWLKPVTNIQVLTIDHPLLGGLLHIAVIPIGQEGADGFAVAGMHAPHSLTDLDCLLLSVAANQAVIALQQARLLTQEKAARAQEQQARAEAQRTAERITLLQELTSRLSQSPTIEQITQVMLEMGMRLFGSDCSRIYILAEEHQSVRILDQLKTPHPDPLGLEEIPLTITTPITDAIRTQNLIRMENLVVLLQQYPHLQTRLAVTNTQAIVAAPLLINDQVWGGIELEFTMPRLITDEEVNLLQAVAQQCSQAIERAQLNEQSRIAATMEERQRLARDLHDAVSQSLFAATITAEALPKLWERNPQRALDKLKQVVQLNTAAMAEMRTLLLELRPDVIINNELDVLLEQLTLAAKGRRKIEIDLELQVKHLFLPPDPHVAFYRIAQEAIHNIMKHSQATRFKVALRQQEQRVSLQIADNGRGFDMNHAGAGLGLSNMRQRSAQIGAVIEFESQPGQGTSITLTWQQPS